MNRYYLAVDIGASSGRHILGWMENGKMNLREIYRFSNGMERVDGTLCWNLVGLFEEIKAGMRECKKLGINPESMGIDTWAVDFVLLDKQGHVLGKTAGYRDRRTEGMDLKVYERISREELYRRTGIQKQIFNTVYQLCEGKTAGYPFTGRKFPYDTGLLKLPADRGTETGVYQCHHHSAGQSL